MDYFQAYKDIWSFHKKYIDVCRTNNDAFWDSVMQDAKEIARKYEDAKFVLDILIAEIEEFNRVFKEWLNSVA